LDDVVSGVSIVKTSLLRNERNIEKAG
jgi:hypothetical protein